MLIAMWGVLQALAPWLLVGALVAGALHALLPKGFIRRRLQGPKGVVTAVALGAPLPLCSCGVIPAGLGLKKDGASDGATLGFMISTPQTGVDSIFVSAAFLGLPFAIFKVFSAVVTGLVGGWTAEAFGTAHEAADQTATADDSRPGWGEGMSHAMTVLRTIWFWIAFGVVASAAIEVWLPIEAMKTLQGWGSFGAALAALAISVPLYVCATASVPIAAALVAGGLPAGAALVFLMAGPATNVATIGAVYRGLGTRNLVIYLVTIIIGSLALGVLFDSVLGGATAVTAQQHSAHGNPVTNVAAVALVGLMVWFAVTDLATKIKTWRVETQEGRLVIGVAGMTCGGCTSRLTRVLEGGDGVDSAVVTLEPGRAVIEGGISQADAEALIEGAGFEVA